MWGFVVSEWRQSEGKSEIWTRNFSLDGITVDRDAKKCLKRQTDVKMLNKLKRIYLQILSTEKRNTWVLSSDITEEKIAQTFPCNDPGHGGHPKTDGIENIARDRVVRLG